MSKEAKRFQQAKNLIRKKKYEKARRILQPLAFSNDEAALLLFKLNKIVPPAEKHGRSRLPGLFMFVILVIASIIIIQEYDYSDAITMNAGYGSHYSPVPRNRWIFFKDSEVRITRMVRPTTTEDAQPAQGNHFVKLTFEYRCKQETCSADNLRFALMDRRGKLWGNQGAPVLGIKDAEGSIAGWTLIEFPEDSHVYLVEVSWGEVGLYAFPTRAGETEF